MMDNAQMLEIPLGKPLAEEQELLKAGELLYEQRLAAFAWMRKQGIVPLRDEEGKL